MNRVASVFRNGNVFRTHSHGLLFVCGGPTGPEDSSFRKQFIDFAKRELSNFHVFLSEHAARDLTRSRRPKFVNLAKFEDVLGGVADCVVLFVESPGSHAELGYFSRGTMIKDKLLVVNEWQFQTRESFINNGPITLINKESNYQPTIQIYPDKLEMSFWQIKERLSRFEKRYRARFELSGFANLHRQDRLFLIFEIVKLFGPIDVHGITNVLKLWCGNPDDEEVRRLISILLSAGNLRRLSNDPSWLIISSTAKSFLDIDKFSFDEFRLELLEQYRKVSPEFYILLQGAGA